MKVLEGLRVLDFGRFIAGPFCAALLADFGADVIRIDRVGGGEDRFIVPVTEGGEGAFFLQVNRNKRSLTLDLDSEAGRDIVRRLVLEADVVIANMPPRTMEALGLDYESLRRIKPDIILTASSAFGNHPAVRDRVGFDGVGQALTGIVHMAGLPDHPMKAMVPMVDFATALSCAFGTVLAIMERQRSGQGQEVNASLLQTGLNLASGSLIEESALKLDRKATANRSPSYAPSDIFRVRDGWVITQVIGAAMFKRWARLVGQPELVDDARFADDTLRGEHGAMLSDIMGRWCADLSRDDALAQLEAARIPAAPVQSPRQVLADERTLATEPFRWMDYPGAAAPLPIVAAPLTLSRTPPIIERRAPTVGEHTDEILRAVGFDQARIDALRAEGVV